MSIIEYTHMSMRAKLQYRIAPPRSHYLFSKDVARLETELAWTVIDTSAQGLTETTFRGLMQIRSILTYRSHGYV